jgi:hypothetical protein
LSRYQVHIRPGENPSALDITVEIVDAAALQDVERKADMEKFMREELLESWKLSGSSSMQTALERGLIASFSVSVVPQFSSVSAKFKRFINHVR